jgi:hypothetical protein
MTKRFLAILAAIGFIVAASSCSLIPGAGDSVVTIEGQNISTPTTWTSDKLYYVKSWVVFHAALTIQPGTIVAFGPAATMTIETDGQLTANGTLSDPIIFTSVKETFADFTIPGISGTPAKGDWDYIWIKGNSSQLSYCTIRYCAQGLDVAANSVSVQNDTFTDNVYGLDARSAGTGFSVGSNTFYGNTHPFLAGRDFSIDNSNTFQNIGGSIKNTWQCIEFDSGYIDANVTWGCTTVAYAVPESNGWLVITDTHTLTLASGTVVKFGIGTGALTIALGAGLSGYAGADFTSIKDDSLLGDSNGDGGLSTPAAGDWDGIYNYNGGSYLTGSFLHYSVNL